VFALDAQAAEAAAAALTGDRGLTDAMGQLNHARGGRLAAGGAGMAAVASGVAPSTDPRHLATTLVFGDDGTTGRPDHGGPPAQARDERAASDPIRSHSTNDAAIWQGRGGLRAARADQARTPRALPDRLAPVTGLRAGGRTDDEGGPGDTPASVAWLRDGRGTGYKADTERLVAPPLIEGRRVDPESGQLEPPPRATDKLGRPNRWDPPAAPRRADAGAAAAHSSVARVEPEPPPEARGGSTVGLSDWERWLEFCARIDGFPRHLSIHSGGMLVTAAPLIDIAPIERATMVDRVVVQFDKRDVETLKLIKLDLLGLGMLAAMDETLQLIQADCATCIDLDRMPEEIPEVFAMIQAADTVGVFQIREPGPDADPAEVAAEDAGRPARLDQVAPGKVHLQHAEHGWFGAGVRADGS